VPSALTTSFQGQGWVGRSERLPSDSTLDLISDKPNRWNAEGEPTIYVSGDPGLALIECGRHPDDLEGTIRLFEVNLRIPRVVDLRDGAVRAALSLPTGLHWILRRDRTQGISRSLRRSGRCDALIVPSAGALDGRDRCNIVVFADDRARVAELVTDLRPGGELRLGSSAAGPHTVGA
jgi:RES domain-containing protein